VDSAPYSDSQPIDCAISDDGTRIHAGQIWRDRKTINKVSSVFVITSVYQRTYNGGQTRTRVNGVVISTGDPVFCDSNRSLDIESMRAMYRFKHFEPFKPEKEEDK
jgi:hypothetical protein